MVEEIVRLIKHDELNELLKLYRYLHPDELENDGDSVLHDTWNSIYHDPSLHYVVVEVAGRIVAACNIAIIKNLTHHLRPYGLIENVITDPNYRKKGYATRALDMVVEIAKQHHCYKVMLLTGSKKDETLRFYEQAGFKQGIKTGFIKNL